MLKKKNTISAMCVLMAMLMVSLSVALPVSAESEKIASDSTAQIPANPEDKIDSALKEKMATASPEEKIPVAIWFEDIDKDELDVAVQQACGISKEDIYYKENGASSDISQLYEAVRSEDEYALKSYVEARVENSEEQRVKNRLYNNTLRNVAAEHYTLHNGNIVSSIAMQTEDIIFLSKLTPFMLARINNSKINEIATSDSVLSIGYYNEKIGEPPSVASDMEAMKIDDSVEKYGLTGDGINVLMIDHDFVRSDTDRYSGIPYPENIRNIYNQVCYYTTNTTVLPPVAEWHGNYVSARLQSVAEDVFIYSTKRACYDDIEWAIQNCDIDVINASLSHGEDIYSNSPVAQWYDSLISTFAIPFVAAGGNGIVNSPYVLSPGSGYNSISIGAYDSTTDRMRNYRYNPISNDEVVRYKPEVVAAAGDTSSATPYVTGIVAMMMELESELSINPALVKAILMASCHSKALPNVQAGDPQEYMTSGLTQKQGAGKVDAYKALGIVLMETYMAGVISSGSQKVETLSFSSSNNVNVSLAWRR